MDGLTHFFKDMIDINVLLLFLISSYLLLFKDYKYFRGKGLKKEGRLSKIMGYAYAALGVGLYIVSVIIKS